MVRRPRWHPSRRTPADNIAEKSPKKAEVSEELPEVDEATVGQLSEEVGSTIWEPRGCLG